MGTKLLAMVWASTGPRREPRNSRRRLDGAPFCSGLLVCFPGVRRSSEAPSGPSCQPGQRSWAGLANACYHRASLLTIRQEPDEL